MYEETGKSYLVCNIADIPTKHLEVFSNLIQLPSATYSLHCQQDGDWAYSLWKGSYEMRSYNMSHVHVVLQYHALQWLNTISTGSLFKAKQAVRGFTFTFELYQFHLIVLALDIEHMLILVRPFVFHLSKLSKHLTLCLRDGMSVFWNILVSKPTFQISWRSWPIRF